MAESKPKTIEQVRRNYRIVVAIAFSYIVVLEILHARLEASFDDTHAMLEATLEKLGQEVVRRDPYVDINFTNADNDAYFENFQVVVLDDFDYYPDIVYGFADADDDGIVEQEAVMGQYGQNMEKTYKVEVFDESRLNFTFVNVPERRGATAYDFNMDAFLDMVANNGLAVIYYQESWHKVAEHVKRDQESFKINTPDGEIELIFGDNGWQEKQGA